MNRTLFLALVWGVSTLGGLGLGAPQGLAEEAFLKVGFAERDITPEIGMEQPGGYGKAFHKSLHDPCKVRASVFDDGKNRVALVGVDALTIRQPLIDNVRKAVHEKCGIAPDAILIGASHSHSSGPTCMVLPGEYDHASPLVQSLAYEKSSCANLKYLELLQKQLVDAICAADQARAEARCGVAKGIEDKVAFNRRFRMKNGMSFTHPGLQNPDIVEPAGPIDPEVGVIGAWDKAGKCIGCVVNYSCHATCNPGGISANWVYYLERTVRAVMGDDCIVVFLQGACGDVTQVNNLNPNTHPASEDWCRLVGGRVGAEAVRSLLNMGRGGMTPVSAKCKTLEITRRRPSPEHVKKALEIVQQPIEKVGHTPWVFAKETVLLDALLVKEPVAKFEVQTIQVGPAVFISNPAEFFVQLGLDIKKQSPFPFTFPVELANGCIGYVPTEEAFGSHGGGYETRLTAYSNLDITAGPQIVAAGVELARQLPPGSVPQSPKAPTFNGSPWDYGSVPPEKD